MDDNKHTTKPSTGALWKYSRTSNQGERAVYVSMDGNTAEERKKLSGEFSTTAEMNDESTLNM